MSEKRLLPPLVSSTKQRKKRDEEEDEEERKKRRRRGFFFWCCFPFGLIALLTVILVPTLVTQINKTSTPPTPTPTPVPECTCNLTLAFDFLQHPPFDSTPGKCIAYNSDDNGLYIFTGNGVGFEYMVRMDVSNVNNITLGPNLAPGATHPAGMEEVRGCIYDNFDFITSSWTTLDLYRYQSSGLSAVSIGTMPLPQFTGLRGFAFVNGNKLYGVDRTDGILFQFNPANAAVIGSGVQLKFNGTNTTGYDISWDAITNQTFVVYKVVGQSNTRRRIGKVDVQTGIIQPTCLTEMRAYASISFDTIGRLWVATGLMGTDPYKLYLTGSAPCVVEI